MTANIVKIGETLIPGICSYEIALSDIDSRDTARSEAGVTKRKVIRKEVKRLSVGCKIPENQLQQVCDMLKEDTVEMTVYCPAATDSTNGYITGTFYVKEKKVKMLSFGSHKYWTLNFTAMEA